MLRFGSTRKLPQEIYLDSSVIIDVFYSFHLPNKPREYLPRLNETHRFIERLERQGSRLYVSLLTIEESLHGTRTMARDNWLKENIVRLPTELKTTVERAKEEGTNRLRISDRDVRKHPSIWDQILVYARAQVRFVQKKITGSSVELLSPEENETTAIVGDTIKLHDAYDLDVADCFHIATGKALGILHYASNDMGWKQLDGVDGITVYSAC